MSDFTTQLEAEMPRLRRYARALAREPGRTDDLVQTCVLRALANEHRWQPGSDLRAWLFTILHNVHISDLRRRLREQRGIGAFATLAPVHCEPKAAFDLVDLERGLAGLSAPHRRVLLLIGLDEVSYEEAAKVLSVKVGTVRSRLGRARASLRRLTDHGPATPTRNGDGGPRERDATFHDHRAAACGNCGRSPEQS